ncbi:MAG: sialidase family protein [candidate division WOR-3 bacterium]
MKKSIFGNWSGVVRFAVFSLVFTIVPVWAAIDVDSVGTTGIDYQNYGPVWQRIFNLPGTGVYVAWVKTGMFANFYSYSTRTWCGEMGVFGTQRNAAGSLDVCPNNSSPYYRATFISSYINRDPKWPIVALESIPGSGSYVMRNPDSALMGCQRPPIAFTQNGWLHLLCADSATQDTLLYSRSTDYGITWSPPVPICGSLLPRAPTYNIVGSETGLALAAIWSHADSQALWVNVSTDGGSSWSGPQNLFPVPTAIPSARPGRLGGSGIYDAQGRLNIVTQVWDGSHSYPAEIWHYQEGRTPAWSLVYRFAPGSVLAQPEPGEPFLCRPTIGQRPSDGRLFVAWMNYDSLNYEPQTQIARADIFVAQSENNGTSWSRPLRLTGPDNGSRLSPCLAANVTDTLVVVCICDQLAGVFENGHGSQTTNQVTVLRVPVSELPGVEESQPPTANRSPLPTTVVRGVLLLPSAVSGSLLDGSGRKVLALHSGPNDLRHLAPGVYFVRLAEGGWREAIVKVR